MNAISTNSIYFKSNHGKSQQFDKITALFVTEVKWEILKLKYYLSLYAEKWSIGVSTHMWMITHHGSNRMQEKQVFTVLELISHCVLGCH